MRPNRRRSKGAIGAFFCFCALHGAAQTGFDTGLRARELLGELKAWETEGGGRTSGVSQRLPDGDCLD